MLRFFIVGIIAVIVIAVAAVLWRPNGGKGAPLAHAPASESSSETTRSDVEPHESSVDAANAAAPADPPAEESPKPQATPGRPVPPAILADWYGWTEAQRLEFVTNAQHDVHLPAETMVFFRAALFDRKLGNVTRNNMASALVSQETRDPKLAETFRKLVEDPSEDVQWRDYSLQFLATTIDWSDSPRAMAATIWKEAKDGPGTVSGTALLHLHYIDERGLSALPYGYGDRLSKCLSDPSVNLSTRMTVVGIIGQRQMKAQAQAVRDLAENSPEPSMRRTALAALGALGDKGDLDLVRRYVDDRDPLIAAAAKGAEQNLIAVQ